MLKRLEFIQLQTDFLEIAFVIKIRGRFIAFICVFLLFYLALTGRMSRREKYFYYQFI